METATGNPPNQPTVMQAIPSSATHSDSNIEHPEPIPMRGLRKCNCVKGNHDDPSQEFAMDTTYNSTSTTAGGIVRPKPLSLSPGNSSPSSARGRLPQRTPSSPEPTAQRSPLQSHSPASLIFERSVQEDILLPQTSPSIPSHIRTENHIPPVLEASSAAITNSELDPDSVEIVTHSLHHPASNCVATTEQLPQFPCPDNGGVDTGNTGDTEEVLSNSQCLEANDIRRLSFISFADVVNAENAETSEHPPSHDPLQRGVASPNPSPTVFRGMSPSPLHSPTSSHGFGTSPPTSISTSFKGLELSPNRGARGADSPLLAVQRPVSPSPSGELNIETMRQALRRTGSGDLSASRNQLPNIAGNDD
ncbi:hypothetical protein BDW59DRAFT_135638 [Aspergillus cavernicola]|uniref:Uncharacterized protein n=1 Tax=Aspergillus cavernicola TaxID=176166 RepID=A0ABR4HN52_9EURO